MLNEKAFSLWSSSGEGHSWDFDMTLLLPSSRGSNKGYKINIVHINRSKQMIFSFQRKRVCSMEMET